MMRIFRDTDITPRLVTGRYMVISAAERLTLTL